jgi:predicted ATPase
MKPMLVLYGLPGAGKTTLCRALGEHGFFYADMTQHPLWAEKTVPYWRMALEQYLQHGQNQPFLTEGVLAHRYRRDYFADRIWRKLGGEARFLSPIIVHLAESITTLDDRRPWRNRKHIKSGGETSSYQDLAAQQETGSDLFRHVELPGDKYRSVEERVGWILRMVSNSPAGPMA